MKKFFSQNLKFNTRVVSELNRRSVFQLIFGLSLWKLGQGVRHSAAGDGVVIKNGWVVKKNEVKD